MIIERLQAHRLKSYSTHLKNLPAADKYTRFCSNASDETIDRFILSILYSLEKHHIFVAREGKNVHGFVHLAMMSDTEWELAVSVNSDQQGKGTGNKLMEHAITWAKTHGIESMFMHCIVDNKKIQHLARKHGLKTVEKDGSDITAKVNLPEATISDRFYNFLNEQSSLMRRIVGLNGKLLSNLIKPS